MSYRLDNHVAVITGNSSGLGKAIGMALGKAGAKLPINYCKNRKRAEATLAEYQQAGIDSMLVQADMTTEAGVKALFDEVEATFGPVDILIPNATCEQRRSVVRYGPDPMYQRWSHALVTLHVPIAQETDFVPRTGW